MTDSEVAILIGYLTSTPSGMKRVGKHLVPSGEHVVILTTDQRDFVVEALRHHNPR